MIEVATRVLSLNILCTNAPALVPKEAPSFDTGVYDSNFVQNPEDDQVACLEDNQTGEWQCITGDSLACSDQAKNTANYLVFGPLRQGYTAFLSHTGNYG